MALLPWGILWLSATCLQPHPPNQCYFRTALFPVPHSQPLLLGCHTATDESWEWMRPSYTCTTAVHKKNYMLRGPDHVFKFCHLSSWTRIQPRRLQLVWEMASILSSRYQPSPRFGHQAVQVGTNSYVWGGRTKDFHHGGQDKLKSTVNVFDPSLETWQEQRTTGVPPRGLIEGAAVAHSTSLYSFAGYDGVSDYNSLHVLDTDMLMWTEVSNTTQSPMPKRGCGMVFFGTHHLATIGGYGRPTEPIQTESLFHKDTRRTDGYGWTNEFHVFDITEGKISNFATCSVILCVGARLALE